VQATKVTIPRAVVAFHRFPIHRARRGDSHSVDTVSIIKHNNQETRGRSFDVTLFDDRHEVRLPAS